MKVQGEEHTDVLELRSVKFSVATVDVNLHSDGRIQDGEDQEELPSTCKDSHACSTGTKTYVFRDAPGQCPYRLIQVELVQGHLQGEPRKLLVSNRTKIMVSKQDCSLNAPASCANAFKQYVPTDVPELAVVFTLT